MPADDNNPTNRPYTPLRLYLIGAFATLLSGYDTGNIGGALLFIKQQLHLTALSEGWVVSSLIIGAILGALGGGKLADRIGRRTVIIAMGYIFLAGSIGEALSPALSLLVVFRFVVGLAVGCASVVVPIYITELAPTGKRGSLTSLFQLMIVIGTLLGYATDAALGPVGAWRWMLALGAIPAIILIIGMRVVPETPRWLCKMGRVDQARRALDKLRKNTDIEHELRLIQSLSTQARSKSASLKALFSRRNRSALVIGIGLAFFTQITGINTIIYYAPTILTTLGLGTSIALITNVGLGLWAIAATVVEILLVDRIGRKPLLLFGSVALCVSMIVVGVSQMSGGTDVVVASIIAVVCFMVFETGFQVGWGAIPSIITSEVFPRDLRGAGAGLCLSINWGINFVVSLTFPLLFAGGSGLAFLIYGGMALCACFFVFYVIPETSGRSLEGIEADMGARSSA